MPLRSFFNRAVSESKTIEIAFDGELYSIRLRRNRQARRYTLRVQAATRQAVLTMPARGSVREARAFAEKHGGWIAARLRRLPEATPFTDGTVVPFRGIPHRIAYRPGRRGTVWIEAGDDGSQFLCVAGAAPHIQRRITDFLKRQAKADLEVASRRFAQTLEVPIRRISIRDQSSRWGSCSTTGVLSYSWRLILAPPFVLDYLAAHEVAHLVEMNHSARFWQIVERLCPDVKGAKSWLDRNGTALHRYGTD